ncbi:hypothetical protein SAMN05421636_105145 [Pricia antarctica]|uniref:Uncharacterized protein n=1 Tax=Pricia antarctica TaxID=641691 RepID=A0A1G7D435_9FLAO|nr:hypothetical protein SAMN05421636_105145 [Pricia antarctica]
MVNKAKKPGIGKLLRESLTQLAIKRISRNVQVIFEQALRAENNYKVLGVNAAIPQAKKPFAK